MLRGHQVSMEVFGFLVVATLSLLLAMLPFAGLVLGLLARSDLRALRLRVDELELELLRRERAEPSAEPKAQPVAEPRPARSALPPPPPPPRPQRPTPAPLPPPRSPLRSPPPARSAISTERVAVWVGSAVGGLLVILASLLALAVAVDRGWVGPAARVLIGLITGTGTLHGALWLRARGHRLVSSALAGAGLGMLYGTLWAAATLYGFLPRPLAMALMVSCTAVALLIADRWRERFVAHLGLVGGLLTPVLLSTGDNRAVALFAYLALLLAGSMAAAARRGWADLVGVGAMGAAAIFLGWTEKYHQPDQVLIGLLAPLVLSVPFVIAASRRATAPLVAAVAAFVALVLPMLAVIWTLPIDPLFYDPRTAASVLRDFGPAPWMVAGCTPLLMLPAWLVARARGWWGVGLAASLVVGLISMGNTMGWSLHTELDPRVPVLLALMPLVFGALVVPFGGLGRATAPLPAMAGAALALALLVPSPPPTEPALAGLALVGFGLLGAFASRRAAWVGSLAIGLFLVANAAGAEVFALGPRLVGGLALLSLAVMVPLPALARHFSDLPAVPVLAGALAGPAFFFPLYTAWDEAFGDELIGVLPLLLAAVALGTAMLLLRARRTHQADPVLALFVAVALLGLSTALPLQLERQWLTIAWALEGAALAALSLRLTHPLLRVASVLLGLGVAVRLLMNPWALEYGQGGGLPVLNWTLYTWGLPALCLVAQAHFLSPTEAQRERVPAFVPPLLRVLAVLVGFALVHVQVSHAFQDAGPIELGGHGLMQGTVRSVAWAVYGVLVLMIGLRSGHRHVRLVGFALVLVAAAKVFTVDLWQLSGFARVGSVLGLGLTLLISAFLFERLVLRQDREEPEPRPPEEP